MQSQPRSPDSLPRNVKLLGVASLLNDIASEMMYPVLPQFFLAVLGGNRFQLGVMEGLAEAVSSLLKLEAGAWSDRSGRRRRFIIFGYVVSALARPLIAFAVVPWHLLATRLLDRLGKGIRTAPRDALIVDSTPDSDRGRAFGFHRAMDHFGAALGPIAAAVFLSFWPGELRTLFLFTLLPGLLAALLLVLGLREVRSEVVPTPRVGWTLKPLSWRFRLYLLALVTFSLGNASDAFLLVRAGELGVAPASLPLLWCAFHLVKSSGNLLAGRAADYWGPRPLILIGWMIYAAIYLAFALIDNAWQVWVAFLVYGLFYALTEPAEKALVASLAGAEHQGLAFGWFNAAIGLASLPSSVLFGWLYERWGAWVAFGWGAGLSALASLLLLGISLRASGTANRGSPGTGDSAHTGK